MRGGGTHILVNNAQQGHMQRGVHHGAHLRIADPRLPKGDDGSQVQVLELPVR